MLLQRGDVAPTGSARRRAPPSAEPASWATGCAGIAAPRARGGARRRRRRRCPGSVGRIPSSSDGASPVDGAGKGSGLRLKRRESRPDVNAAGCRGEDEDGDARLDSAI